MRERERERAILPGFHMGLAFRGFILLGRYVVKFKHSESFRTFIFCLRKRLKM